MKNIGEYMIYLSKTIKVFIQAHSKKVEWLKEKFEDISVAVFLIIFFTVGTPLAMIVVLTKLIFDRSYRDEIFGVHIRQ